MEQKEQNMDTEAVKPAKLHKNCLCIQKYCWIMLIRYSLEDDDTWM